MSVRTGIGLVGLGALAVVIAITRYDGFNQGGGDRYKAPPRSRALVFQTKVTRYLVVGKQDDPRSPNIHWTVGTAMGSEVQPQRTWERNMGKFPPHTWYALYVQPGRDVATVATQEVTVVWGGTVICGPTEEHGSQIPRCEGYTG